MRRLFPKGPSAPAEVVARAGLDRSEKVLAAAEARDGTWLLGSRDALVLVRSSGPVTRIPWQGVESADWSRDDDRLRVAEVGEFGRRRPEHEFALDDPGLLLPLLRERVTASVVLQRRVSVEGKRGLSVVARRAPTGGGPIVWAYELDPGVDPDDPEVRRLADAGLRAAAEELGLT
jgi:hypothetical protein